MVPPLTDFETGGTWTTLANETVFLEQVAAETDALLSIAGYSTDGHRIHRVDLGQGVDNTYLVVTLQHGDEVASREAALAQIRDMAYSDDPAIVDYLAGHRIVWLTNVSPDQFPDGRRNGNDIDPNRDHVLLSQIETAIMANVIDDAKPNMILDAHEYFAESLDWLGSGGALPSTHSSIALLQQSCYEAGLVAVQSEGYTAGAYADHMLPRAGLSMIAGARHAVGILSETNAKFGDPAVRVPVQRLILDTFQQWHADHADECAEAAHESRQWALQSDAPYPLVRIEHVNREEPTSVDAMGYRLLEPLPDKYVQAFGLTVRGDYVPLRQDARGIVPMLLDSESMDAVVSAERVPWPSKMQAMPETQLLGMVVQVDGERRQVDRVIHKWDGVTREVQIPGR